MPFREELQNFIQASSDQLIAAQQRFENHFHDKPDDDLYRNIESKFNELCDKKKGYVVGLSHINQSISESKVPSSSPFWTKLPGVSDPDVDDLITVFTEIIDYLNSIIKLYKDELNKQEQSKSTVDHFFREELLQIRSIRDSFSDALRLSLNLEKAFRDRAKATSEELETNVEKMSSSVDTDTSLSQQKLSKLVQAAYEACEGVNVQTFNDKDASKDVQSKLNKEERDYLKKFHEAKGEGNTAEALTHKQQALAYKSFREKHHTLKTPDTMIENIRERITFYAELPILKNEVMDGQFKELWNYLSQKFSAPIREQLKKHVFQNPELRSHAKSLGLPVERLHFQMPSAKTSHSAAPSSQPNTRKNKR